MRTRPIVAFSASLFLMAGVYACQDTFPSQLPVYDGDSGPSDFDALEPTYGDAGPDVEVEGDGATGDASVDARTSGDAASDATSDHETDGATDAEPSLDAPADG